MILGKDGKPVKEVVKVESNTPVEFQKQSGNLAGYFKKEAGGGSSALIEKFDTPLAEQLAARAREELKRTYPGYGWVVRAIGNKHVAPRFGITLTEILHVGGSKLVYFINRYNTIVEDEDTGVVFPDKDGWKDEVAGDFERLVRKAGGVLLECSGLSREKKKADQYLDFVPTEFEPLLPKIKQAFVEVNSIREFEKAVEDHLKRNQGAATNAVPEVDGNDFK